VAERPPRIERIDPVDLAPPSGYAYVVKAGDTVYLSGVAGIAADGSIVGEADPSAQVEQAIHNLRTSLRSVGAGLEHLVRWTVYLTDPAYIPAWQEVRSRHIGVHRPAGTLIIVAGLALPGLMVEIDGIAVVG
jgi:enamine deaminase RidA (YjgF/YER057c/UK114 family)